MKSQKQIHNQFYRATVALAVAGITAKASAANLSWNPPTENTNLTLLTGVTGYAVYYGAGPIASDCSNGTGPINIGNVTNVTLPPNLFTANTPYYVSARTIAAEGQSACATSVPATPNPQGVQSAGSLTDTRVAMTVTGVSPAPVYLFTVNTLGQASPVVQQSTGGYSPFSYSTQEDATARLSIFKAAANSLIVNEIDITNNTARQSASFTNTTAIGNPANDSRAYGAEKGFGYRLYLTPQGSVSFQNLDQQDFAKALIGPLNTYPSSNPGVNSVTSTTGVTTSKVAQEIRSDANGVVIFSLTYQGGGNNGAVGLWTLPSAIWNSATQITNSTLPSNIAQSYLPAKQDTNGLYNYVGMGISGNATPALNIAYAQQSAAQTKVIVDYYAGVAYPGSFPAGTTGQSPAISCSSSAFTYPAGTSVVRFDVQGDGLGRIWTQSAAGNLSYTLTDTSNCNASAGTYAFTRPASVPSNAVLIGNGL